MKLELAKSIVHAEERVQRLQGLMAVLQERHIQLRVDTGHHEIGKALDLLCQLSLNQYVIDKLLEDIACLCRKASLELEELLDD